MSAGLAVALLNLLFGQARELYVWAKQNHGEAIPEWSDLAKGFDSMQAKLDAAKRE